jgi:hypothetical protein
LAKHLPSRQTNEILPGGLPVLPLPPREGGVRAKQSQGKRFRFLDCHTLI